ncbi:hypothetical protein JB92DRAFT_2839443 [Gautieria morchelliformis]|nr:hypothetical protein JB92DRAFT_2839443 [Gautieria morchelliformis]
MISDQASVRVTIARCGDTRQLSFGRLHVLNGVERSGMKGLSNLNLEHNTMVSARLSIRCIGCDGDGELFRMTTVPPSENKRYWCPLVTGWLQS